VEFTAPTALRFASYNSQLRYPTRADMSDAQDNSEAGHAMADVESSGGDKRTPLPPLANTVLAPQIGTIIT
jgi:hypothetical protein